MTLLGVFLNGARDGNFEVGDNSNNAQCYATERPITPLTRVTSAPRLLPVTGRASTRPSSRSCGAPATRGAAATSATRALPGPAPAGDD